MAGPSTSWPDAAAYADRRGGASDDPPGAAGARQALLRAELQHRVANDFASVSALLRLRRREVADPSARALLDDAAAHVEAIALVHQAAEPGQDNAEVELALHLPQLIGRLQAAYLDGRPVVIASQIEAARVPLAVARTLGLITVELVRNSVKHAFRVGERGVITVALEADETSWWLRVSDNGRGLPEPPSTRSDGRGLVLVQALAHSIGARAVIDQIDHGTTILVEAQRARVRGGGHARECPPVSISTASSLQDGTT